MLITLLCITILALAAAVIVATIGRITCTITFREKVKKLFESQSEVGRTIHPLYIRENRWAPP